MQIISFQMNVNKRARINVVSIKQIYNENALSIIYNIYIIYTNIYIYYIKTEF